MKNIRIGTRNSPLAIWQARMVSDKLNLIGYETEIIPMVSAGDKNLVKPIYSLGIVGVFTKDLDISLLNNEVDVAVHSLKDVPTKLPENIIISAVLERDFPQDVLIRNSKARSKHISELSIATSSLRRRAFWLNKYPNTNFFDIRGNVHTRLEKLENGLADATILSLAGINRLKLDIKYEHLPFFIQAPSQGVVCCTSLKENTELNKILSDINHTNTEKCIKIERDFLRILEGGCTAPIGASAEILDNEIHFRGILTSLNGKKYVDIDRKIKWSDDLGIRFAKQILNEGGAEIIEEVKKVLENK